MAPKKDQNPNHTAYFHAKHDHAQQLYADGRLAEADNVCRELIASLDCPRLLQVHAWQIRSNCSTDFFSAKSFLNEVFPLLDTLPRDYHLDRDDGTYQEIEAERKQTNLMLDDLQQFWDAKWEKIGQPAPQTEEEAGAMERARKSRKKNKGRRNRRNAERKASQNQKEVQALVDKFAGMGISGARPQRAHGYLTPEKSSPPPSRTPSPMNE